VRAAQDIDVGVPSSGQPEERAQKKKRRNKDVAAQLSEALEPSCQARSAPLSSKHVMSMSHGGAPRDAVDRLS
jgi:hypothetical protein